MIESIGLECVRTTLDKNEPEPWLRQRWAIPPQTNAEFVCDMEDALDVYGRHHKPARPMRTGEEALTCKPSDNGNQKQAKELWIN